MNVIPEIYGNYQVSFTAMRDDYYNDYYNIIRLTATPLDHADVAGGSRILYMNIHKDMMKNKIHSKRYFFFRSIWRQKR